MIDRMSPSSAARLHSVECIEDFRFSGIVTGTTANRAEILWRCRLLEAQSADFRKLSNQTSQPLLNAR